MTVIFPEKLPYPTTEGYAMVLLMDVLYKYAEK